MILIDAMMLVHRCANKMDFLKNDAGVPTGMEFGFLRTVQSLTKKYPGHSVVSCWDSPRATLLRREKDPRYKANRQPMDDALRDRVATLRTFSRGFYSDASANGHEADDVMYSLAAEHGDCLVYTNDKDLLQCADDARNVKVVRSFQSKLFEWTAQSVRDEYGVEPRDLPLFRAFVGDVSDNLSGIKRVDRALLAAVINWCRDVNADYDVEWAIGEIASADWRSPVVKAAMGLFVDEGFAATHYELMKLRRVPVVQIRDELDRAFAVATLNRWQIRTLDLCEQFRAELAAGAGDEF